MMNIQRRTLHDDIAERVAEQDPQLCPLELAAELRRHYPTDDAIENYYVYAHTLCNWSEVHD